MKFSYNLLKRLVPNLPEKKELIKKINLYSFEAALLGGDTLDIAISPNRFSDAASHWGMAREVSAILGKNFRLPIALGLFSAQQKKQKNKTPFDILIKDKTLCPRYSVYYFEGIKIQQSPGWLKKILKDCGLRPINNVVDVMNYVMLETGQPLHAFDYDKLLRRSVNSKSVVVLEVRKAKKGEKIEALDDKIYFLDENDLVITDTKNILAIAGIKGGKYAEVDKNTRRILVEAATFDGINIYKTSRRLNLFTDASLRFSHHLSSELVVLGMKRAAQLLRELADANPGFLLDLNYSRSFKKVIKFQQANFEKFIGIKIDLSRVNKYLKVLGFVALPCKQKDEIVVEVPFWRPDIETFEDLAEEIARLYGYDNIPPLSPRVHLVPSGFEDRVILKNQMRRILLEFGLDEVYNYSFISQKSSKDLASASFGIVELENPFSQGLYCLRPSLIFGFLNNIEHNLRFRNSVRIFELGKIFFRDSNNVVQEKLRLGIAFYAKEKETFFDLKGMVEKMLKRIGLVDFLMVPLAQDNSSSFPASFLIDHAKALQLESNSTIFGYLGRVGKFWDNAQGINVIEIDLDTLLNLVVGENEYRPLPKHPAVMRDLSIAIKEKQRVGEIMQAIQEIDLQYIKDVDLMDEYNLLKDRSISSFVGAELSPADKNMVNQQEEWLSRGLTFRIIFQAENRTLTDEEVKKLMKKIEKMLQTRFQAQIR